MKYFISYVYYEAGDATFGNAEWEGEAITSLDQIISIEQEIANGVNDKKIFVKMSSWQRFENQ